MVNAAPQARRLWLAWLSGILLLGVVAIVIARRGEELRFADLLKQVQPGWLLLALLLQIGTYACAAGAWQRVLSRQLIPTSLWQLIPLGLGKLLIEPLRHIKNPQFNAAIFRRTYPQITMPGGMWDESTRLYPMNGGRANQNELDWTFPSGARASFRHLQPLPWCRRWLP